MLANLNLDPRPDLLALDAVNDTIQVFMNSGGALPATPGAVVPIDPAGTLPNGIAVRDIDSVGGPELAITHGNGGNDIAIMTATVAGVISPLGLVSVAGPQFAPNIVDIDNDGDFDLVCLVEPEGGEGAQIVVALGDGATLGEAAVLVQDALIGRQLEIADLDGDGAYDMAIRSTAATGILLLVSDP